MSCKSESSIVESAVAFATIAATIAATAILTGVLHYPVQATRSLNTGELVTLVYGFYGVFLLFFFITLFMTPVVEGWLEKQQKKARELLFLGQLAQYAQEDDQRC